MSLPPHACGESSAPHTEPKFISILQACWARRALFGRGRVLPRGHCRAPKPRLPALLLLASTRRRGSRPIRVPAPRANCTGKVPSLECQRGQHRSRLSTPRALIPLPSVEAESESATAAAVTGSVDRERGSRPGPPWRSAMTRIASRRTPLDNLFAEITAKIIAKLEAGRLPWVQPWASDRAPSLGGIEGRRLSAPVPAPRGRRDPVAPHGGGRAGRIRVAGADATCTAVLLHARSEKQSKEGTFPAEAARIATCNSARARCTRRAFSVGGSP
jgi:hypothetical protein